MARAQQAEIQDLSLDELNELMSEARLQDLPPGGDLNGLVSEIRAAQKNRLLEIITKAWPFDPNIPSWNENAARNLVDTLLLTNPVPTYHDLMGALRH